MSFIDELVHEAERGIIYSLYLQLEASDEKELALLHKELQNISQTMDLTFNRYTFGQKKIAKVQPYLVPTSIPQPTVPPDATATWKTYTDTKYGFEFKYPTDWLINEVNSDGQLEIIPPIRNEKSTGEIVFLIIPKEKNVSINTFLSESNPITGGKNSDVYKVEKEFVVNGNKVVFARGGCCGWFGKHALVEDKNGKYSLDIVLKDPLLSKPIVNENIFNQILSTFKFLDTQDMTDSLVVANKYLTAYVSKDWDTVRNMLGCKASDAECFVQNAAESYGFVKYEILNKNPLSNSEYNYYDIVFYDKNGTKYSDAPHNQGNLKLMLIKDSSGNWRPMTWYFYE